MLYKHGTGSPFAAHVTNVYVDDERNAGGTLLRTLKGMTIEGKVYGATQHALTLAIEAFETMFETPVSKTGFLENDGTTDSAHVIDLADGPTEAGIVCRVEWLSPPQTAQYVSYRHFRVTISAAFLGEGADGYQYENSLTGSGGGPVIVARRTFDGPAIQQAYPSTEYRYVETGRKASRIAEPVPKAPYYPDAQVKAPGENPVTNGKTIDTDGIVTYWTSWTYNYLSATPLY